MNRVNHLISQLQPSAADTFESPKKCLTSNEEKIGFEYTIDEFADKLLTKEQRQFYEENGYLVIHNHLSKEDVKILNDHFDNLAKNPKIRVPNMNLMRDITLASSNNQHDKNAAIKQKVITKLQYWSLDEVFYKNYLCKDKVIKYLECFVGDNIASIHHMYINKPSDPGTLTSRHPLHQDNTFWPITNANRIVACWTALQDITRRNGGLCVIPKSHKFGMLKHDYPQWDSNVNKMYYAISKKDYKKYARNRVHLNMKCGDTVFFHPYLIHGSSANLSNDTRRSMCVHFASTTQCDFMNGDYYTNKCDYVPPSYVKTTQYIMKQKHNINECDIVDVWRLKSRVVKGKQGNWAMPLSYWRKWDDNYYLGLRPDYTNNPDQEVVN